MASESKTDFSGKVVVSGATGNIGKGLLASLASKFPAASIVALTRDPTSDKAKAIASDSVTVAASADYSFDASDVVVIVPPGSENRAAVSVGVAKAATAAGVSKIISYSVPTLGSVLFARQFKELDAGVRAVAPSAILVKLPFFTDNNWGHAATIKGMGKIFAPVPVDTKYAQVTVSDAGEVGATLVAKFDQYAGQTFTLVSNTSSQADIAAAFTEALGKEVEAVQVPPSAAKEALLGMGFPEWQVEGILELWAVLSSDDVGVQATVNVRSSDVEALLGRKGTSIPEWVGAVKAGFAGDA